MDEEVTIIDNNTKIEKIKIFFINNRKKILIIASTTLILIVGYFSFDEIKNRNKIKLANQFNIAVTGYENDKNDKITKNLENIINEKDATYSPLALYFLIDNNLIEDQGKINKFFDVLINYTNLDNEIKNLIIYKKALYNSDFIDENELIKMLNPLINSKSLWQSHGLYLIAEYFFSKNEDKKAKEFFNKIVNLKNVNNDIKTKAQKRLNRDLSE
jgi:predicted negative regulator of RcsB-dependent stress response